MALGSILWRIENYWTWRRDGPVIYLRIYLIHLILGGLAL